MKINSLLNPAPQWTAPDHTAYGQLIASVGEPALSSRSSHVQPIQNFCPYYDHYQAGRTGPIGIHQPLGTVSENRDQTVTLTRPDSQLGDLYSQLQALKGMKYLYMLLPGNEAPIQVPIDRSKASKEMDQKRRRGARVSTRYRNRRAVLVEIAENKEKLQQVLQ